MRQSKLESILEIGLGTLSGMVVAFLVVQGLEPFMEYTMSPSDNVLLTSILTITSLLRKYIIRRFFANGIHKVVHTFVKGLIIEKDISDSEKN